MKVVKIGIMNRDDFRQRTISIASGAYKPSADEPKVWFDSIESMSRLLNTKNIELLKTIRQCNPSSLGELSEITGRRKESLSRTIKKMGDYGLIEIKEGPRHAKIPVVVADSFEVKLM